jgi:hypothetical protein
MREAEAVAEHGMGWWVGLASLAAMALGSLIALSAAPAALLPSAERAPAVAQRSWAEHVELVDEAVGRGDVSAGVRRWHDAYASALASRRPEALVAAGEAFVRLSVAAGTPDGGKPNARRAYLAALGLARRQHSVEGVLSVAGAFRALGDREVAEHCVRMAEALAIGRAR